jgi:hypothetical protein
MTIKYADQKIKEARQRIVALDWELAEIRRQSHSRYLSRQVKRRCARSPPCWSSNAARPTWS